MLITKLSDILTGKNVAGYHKMYQKTQWYNKQQMKEYQLNKLRKLLKHCYENVSYYTKLMSENSINPDKIDSLNILQSFPILTKEIIQQNYNDFIPKNIRMLKGVKISQTGGTTGNILFKRNDANTRSSVWGSYKRFEEWMGLKNNYKTLVLMGGHIKKSSFKDTFIRKGISFLENSVSVDVYNTSNATIEKIITLLLNNDFSLIRSYPQFLFQLALELEKRRLQFDIKAITTTAEPVMAEHRKLFKKVFNADVFDQYGCGEIGCIANECEKHEGLHINEERVVLEQNEYDELLITDLDNYSMPFIRYWNADQALTSDINCTCGRQSKLIKQILGRTCDYIFGIDGQLLHWAYFWHLIFDSNIAKNRDLNKFQIVQKSKSNILIKLVANSLSKTEMDFIINDIKKRLGNINIELSYENDIENTSSGKYRPVINNLL
jgi:phenylacetate-CoA ligase